MAGKAEKQKRRREEAVKTALIPLILGLALVVLGAVGLWQNKAEYRAYSRSTDVRTVKAMVERVEVRERKDIDDTLETVWDADVSFEVNGKTYTGTVTRERKTERGDTVKVEVYRTSSGEYKIPPITSKVGKGLSDILMYVSMGVGGFLAAGGIWYMADEFSAGKKKKKKA